MATGAMGTGGSMTELHHRFAFAPEYRMAGRALGITPGSCVVTVTDRYLHARFGRWQVRTRLSNVADAHVTGPYARLKTIGPPHLSFADRGLTFATNRERGVCIEFATPVKGIEPLGLLRHPALTVTVEDPEALAAVLSAAGEATGAVETDDLVADLHDDLAGMTASELRRRVRELGIPGASGKSKAELIALLEEPIEARSG